ncbi:MAG: papain-like cysteine peptidase [Beijerinckiaceae bacterium]|nr:papain-like cysteine peptidase [Beijerinckiaceae bacterium]
MRSPGFKWAGPPRIPFFRFGPRLAVDRIISLGGLCEAAYQARRLSRSERAYIFDWWITPLESVCVTLDAGAACVFKPKHLVKVPNYGGKPALYSRLSRTIHLHEYAEAIDFLALDIKTIAAALQEKYAALHARMLADCASGTTLFVRQKLSGHDPAGPELEVQIDRTCANLNAIAADYRLLLLDYEPIAPRERLIQSQVPRLKDANDLGSCKGWDALFRAHSIDCLRPGTRFSFDDLKATFGGGG